jgi:hypothetical protein
MLNNDLFRFLDRYSHLAADLFFSTGQGTLHKALSVLSSLQHGSQHHVDTDPRALLHREPVRRAVLAPALSEAE